MTKDNFRESLVANLLRIDRPTSVKNFSDGFWVEFYNVRFENVSRTDRENNRVSLHFKLLDGKVKVTQEVNAFGKPSNMRAKTALPADAIEYAINYLKELGFFVFNILVMAGIFAAILYFGN